MNVIPKTYDPATFLPGPAVARPLAVVSINPGADKIKKMVAALPEYERLMVEAIITDLDNGIDGAGPVIAREIAWALCEWMRRGQNG